VKLPIHQGGCITEPIICPAELRFRLVLLDHGDLDELAAQALTDQPNDKKIDFIFLDLDDALIATTKDTRYSRQIF
jgi:hypothetical protein